MAKAHVCVQCGKNLAHIRAHREPHYGFALIICPQCGSASERRRHPLIVSWRNGRQLARAAIAIAHRVVGTAVLMTITSVSLVLLAEVWQSGSWMDLFTQHRGKVIFGLFILPATTGLWLGFAFAHLRAVVTWLLWMGLFIVIAGLIVTHEALEFLVDDVVELVGLEPSHMDLLPQLFVPAWCVTYLFIHPGRVLVGPYQRWLRQRWKRRLALARQRRSV